MVSEVWSLPTPRLRDFNTEEEFRVAVEAWQVKMEELHARGYDMSPAEFALFAESRRATQH
jgi:hypothetical protein